MADPTIIDLATTSPDWSAIEASATPVLLVTDAPRELLGLVPRRWFAPWRDFGGPPEVLKPRWPPHVYVGARVRNQAEADARIPELLRIPAAVRVVYAVPLEGAVDVERFLGDNYSSLHGGFDPGVSWVIAAGGDRPVHPAWLRSLRDQCSAAGVPFAFTGWGAWWPGDGGDMEHVHRLANRLRRGSGPTMFRVGPEASGRLLDGVAHDGAPNALPPGSAVEPTFSSGLPDWTPMAEGFFWRVARAESDYPMCGTHDAATALHWLGLLREVRSFAEGHHGDQDPSLWLHALTVDIPALAEEHSGRLGQSPADNCITGPPLTADELRPRLQKTINDLVRWEPKDDEQIEELMDAADAALQDLVGAMESHLSDHVDPHGYCPDCQWQPCECPEDDDAPEVPS